MCALSSDHTVCIKCKGQYGPPVVLLRKDDHPLCKACFLDGCMYKFRSSFGKANIVKNREAVALAFSGGSSSLAMLHLVRTNQAKTEPRKLRFDTTVVCLYDSDQPYPVKQENILKESGFEYRIVRTDEIPFSSADCRLHMNSRLSNSALTAAEEMLRWRRLHQLAMYASHVLGYKYLLVGENASQLASFCLSGIALGRGGTVATELGFADTRYNKVTVLRPMSGFLAHEVSLLLHFAGLELVSEPTLSTQQNLAHGPGTNSIHRLTQDFISSLQFAGFPSTTTAVLNAATRTYSGINGLDQFCTMCYAPLMQSGELANVNETPTAAASYEFSVRISRSKKPDCVPQSSISSIFPTDSLTLCSCCRVNCAELQQAGL